MSKVPLPKIDRSLTLHCQGDWGRTNLHRSLGWLSYQMGVLAGPHTRVAIWNGRGQRDNIQAVGRGQVDYALAVPQNFVHLAMDGVGPCAGESFPHLRALGHVPQHDRMLMAIRKEFGITSLPELREKMPALRIAMGPQDGISFIGLAADLLLEAAGISRASIEAAGGRIIEKEEPRACCREVLEGRADAIIMEAVMTDYYKLMADNVDMNFIPVDPATAANLAKLGLGTGTLPANYLRGIEEGMQFLDFSHFLLITTTDLPDDVAYGLAWSLIEGWEVLERQYRHLPPERSPVSYPIDPKLCANTPIPLHPGAERYYRDAGHL